MNIVLMGPLASGKGTYGEMIAAKYNLPTISTGELLRQAILRREKDALVAETYMKKGALVPLEIIMKILKKRLNMADCKNGFILDGFPRSFEQAEELDKITKIDCVFYFVVPHKVIFERIAGRRVCPNCSGNFNTKQIGDRKDCPNCSSTLVIREDDQDINAIEKRLQIFEKETKKVIDSYKKRNILFSISGNREKEDVLVDIVKVIEKCQ